MKPLQWVMEERQVAMLWTLAALVLAVGLVLDQLEPPGGWVALEFPALPGTADPGATWTLAQKQAAIFGLGLDYLFLAIYPLFLSMFLGWAVNHWRLGDRLSQVSAMASFVVILAAPLDALENAGLYFFINGNSDATLRWFITLTSAAKWIIVLTAAMLALICAGIRLLGKRTASAGGR